MPKMVVRSPLHELNLPHQHRFHPPALFDLLGGETLSAAPVLRFWQIREWTLGDLQAAGA